eukprot:TRINITY_DN2766_c0_g1_i4.p1 TRINITY_DN2766_c0_g1~~TRINITY_DN2766_c0_g1_i4.p1  ORF type:complete len:152 (+),score=24.56 TRINITY_DN2766_c0_g1_i4:28-483(+)
MSESITLDDLRRSGGSETCILDVSSAIEGSKLVWPENLNKKLRKTRHLTITGKGVGSITEIGDGFLKNCRTLTTLNINQLHNITRIGNRFLEWCSSLKSIDLTQLGKVTQVEKGFLYECKSLTSIVTSIDLTSLTSIDLTPLDLTLHWGKL